MLFRDKNPELLAAVAVDVVMGLHDNFRQSVGYDDAAQRARKRLFVDVWVVEHAFAEFATVRIHYPPMIGVVVPSGIVMTYCHMEFAFSVGITYHEHVLDVCLAGRCRCAQAPHQVREKTGGAGELQISDYGR